MHIEPGLVDGTKIILSYATGAVAVSTVGKLAVETIIQNRNLAALAIRSLIATIAVFVFFELMPHYPVGVSEVHFILGSTLFLILGTAPAAIGLALGLLIQGLFFAPIDLPQYGMNVTTLLVPLFAISIFAKSIVAPKTAYVDLQYKQAFALSTAYQGGVVAWVAFWAIYGNGFAMDNLQSIATFGGAYMAVVLVEPFADLAILAIAKALKGFDGGLVVQDRVYSVA